jgi:general secretion pathway protein A
MSSSPVIALKDVFGNTSHPRHFLEFQTRALPLQILSGAIEEGFNVRMLVGEPGVGKTALLLRLVQQLQSTALTTRLFLTQLRPSEFLHYFLQELGVARPSPNFAEAQKQLTSVLERNFSHGRQVMVVIDEAHELKISTLRAVAELLNCPLGRSEQLRIILAGLPVLKVRTASPPLAEFSKRISGVASLGPLTFEESCSYIRQKIALSGFRDDQRFNNDAIVLIAKLTGIPGDINNICFESLYRAEQRGYGRVDEGLVLEVAAEEGNTSAQTDAQEVSSTEARVALQCSKAQAKTPPEAMLKAREEELPGDGESAAPLIRNDVPESEASHQQPADELSNGVETDAVPPSAFEKTLEALLSSQFDSTREWCSSKLRHAVMPVLLSIFALGLALAIAYTLLSRRGLSAHISPTTTRPTVGDKRGAVIRDVRPRVIANGPGNVTPIPTPSPAPSSQVLYAARSGDANAQLELGSAYATGRGVPEDFVTAYTWLTLAFANGNKQAMSLISELTRRLDSAEIGRIRWNIGEMYADGVGVPQNNVTAYMWHLLAEISGETRSRVARERLARSMTADQKSEAQARASEWLRKHHQAAKTVNLAPKLN